jgi:hypothetical protein
MQKIFKVVRSTSDRGMFYICTSVSGGIENVNKQIEAVVYPIGR